MDFSVFIGKNERVKNIQFVLLSSYARAYIHIYMTPFASSPAHSRSWGGRVDRGGGGAVIISLHCTRLCMIIIHTDANTRVSNVIRTICERKECECKIINYSRTLCDAAAAYILLSWNNKNAREWRTTSGSVRTFFTSRRIITYMR